MILPRPCAALCTRKKGDGAGQVSAHVDTICKLQTYLISDGNFIVSVKTVHYYTMFNMCKNSPNTCKTSPYMVHSAPLCLPSRIAHDSVRTQTPRRKMPGGPGPLSPSLATAPLRKVAADK